MDENKAPDPLIDLGRARFVRHRPLVVRLPVAERLRAARGMPQAVVKVAAYASGKARVHELVKYITREGRLALETDRGDVMQDSGQYKSLIEAWAIDFDERKQSRDAVHIILSMPPGSALETLKKCTQKVLAGHFPDHEWVFALHEDRKHPHAHAVVKMRGREGEKKLRLNKPELYRMRESLARAARELGVPLAASPRAARGIGHKATSRALYHLRTKGITPVVERKAAQEALIEVRQGARRKPWEAAIEARHRQEVAAYQADARALREQARLRDGSERERLEKAAQDLERFAKDMPEPLTRRQAWIKKAQVTARDITKSPDSSRDRESTTQ